MSGNQASNLLTMMGNRDYLAMLNEVEQVTRFVLCLDSSGFTHGTRPMDQQKSAYQ